MGPLGPEHSLLAIVKRVRAQPFQIVHRLAQAITVHRVRLKQCVITVTLSLALHADYRTQLPVLVPVLRGCGLLCNGSQRRLGSFLCPSQCSLDDGRRVARDQAVVHGLQDHDRTVDVGEETVERGLGPGELSEDHREQDADGEQGVRRIVPPETTLAKWAAWVVCQDYEIKQLFIECSMAGHTRSGSSRRCEKSSTSDRWHLPQTGCTGSGILEDTWPPLTGLPARPS